MYKILYIVSTLKRCSPTNWLYTLISNLDRNVFEPHLITLSPEPANSRWMDFQNLGVQLSCLRMSRIRSILYVSSEIEELIERITPNIIHSSGMRPDMLSARLKSTLPKASTVHNFPQTDYKMSYGEWRGALMCYIHVQHLKKLDLCIGVSAAVEENLKRSFSVRATKHIRNGVNNKVFSPVGHFRKMELREALDLPLNARIWVSAGHLTPLKDPEFLISQWRLHKSSFYNDYLLLLGNGILMDRCVALARETPRVLLRGRVDNVVKYLQASDYYVSSSHSEGLPYSVIEGLACGLPCLLSDIAPHKEITDLGYVVGKTFKLGSERNFIEQAVQLRNDEYCNMRQAAVRLVYEDLNSEIMSKRYQKIYLSLLSSMS